MGFCNRLRTYEETLFPTAYFCRFDSDSDRLVSAKLFRCQFQMCDTRFIFLEIGSDFMRRRTVCINGCISNKDDHMSVPGNILRIEVQGNFWILLDVFVLV